VDKRLADFPSTPEGFAPLPTVSLVVGNGDQSMHDRTIAQGDAWVKSKFGAYIDWPRRTTASSR
jgi:acid phosphatase